MILIPDGSSKARRRRQIPSSESISKSEDILRQTIRDSGLVPGVYKKAEEVDYGSVAFVHTRLCELLEDEIARYRLVDACAQLYRIHESLMAQDEILTGQDAIGIHSLRSLIELAVKCCDESGVPLDEEGCDFLLALAIQAVDWDHSWDQFSLGMFEQGVSIGQAYEFKLQELPERYQKAQREYEKDVAARKRIMEISQDEGIVVPDGVFQRKSLSLWIKESGFLELDSCLETEIGYSLTDYMLFRNAALGTAIVNEVDIVGLIYSRVVLESVTSLGLEESAIIALIEDFALSKSVVGGVPSTEIFSTGRRNRDSRFIRRPIVLATSTKSA